MENEQLIAFTDFWADELNKCVEDPVYFHNKYLIYPGKLRIIHGDICTVFLRDKLNCPVDWSVNHER